MIGKIILYGMIIAIDLIISFSGYGREAGQWEKLDPSVRLWFRELKQPDNPTVSCCGEADSYWADSYEAKDGRYLITITDEREDAPLGRPHIPSGTQLLVPNHKIKWNEGNPTGHGVVFVAYNDPDHVVLCYVPPGGV